LQCTSASFALPGRFACRDLIGNSDLIERQRVVFIYLQRSCSFPFVQVVLSACSSYFQKLLLSNPCKHPTIIMPQDVCFNDLKFIIEFVYRGEIDVSQAELQVSARKIRSIFRRVRRPATRRDATRRATRNARRHKRRFLLQHSHRFDVRIRLELLATKAEMRQCSSKVSRSEAS